MCPITGSMAGQFALDCAEHVALLSGDEDTVPVLCILAVVALVDLGALDIAACEPFGIIDDCAQGVAVIRIARQRATGRLSASNSLRRLCLPYGEGQAHRVQNN